MHLFTLSKFTPPPSCPAAVRVKAEQRMKGRGGREATGEVLLRGAVGSIIIQMSQVITVHRNHFARSAGALQALSILESFDFHGIIIDLMQTKTLASTSN